MGTGERSGPAQPEPLSALLREKQETGRDLSRRRGGMNSRAGPVGSGVPRRRGAVGVSERGWTGQERPRRGAAEEPAPGARLPPGFMLGYVRPSCDPGHVLHLCASVSSSVGRTPPWERGCLEQGLAPGHHGGSTCGPPAPSPPSSQPGPGLVPLGTEVPVSPPRPPVSPHVKGTQFLPNPPGPPTGSAHRLSDPPPPR